MLLEKCPSSEAARRPQVPRQRTADIPRGALIPARCYHFVSGSRSFQKTLYGANLLRLLRARTPLSLQYAQAHGDFPRGCTKGSFYQKYVTQEPLPSRASHGPREPQTSELVKAGPQMRRVRDSLRDR